MATTTAPPLISLPSTPVKLDKAATPEITVSEIKPAAAAAAAVAAPSGFKLVKVRRQDGTVVTVKRPIVSVPKDTSAAVPITQTAPTQARTPKVVPKVEKLAPRSTTTPVATAAPKPATVGSKATSVTAAASIPAKKKWFSGLSKGIPSLNVDKITSAIDSIENATSRIDAALTGKPIPPKRSLVPGAAPSTTSSAKPATTASPTPISTVVVTAPGAPTFVAAPAPAMVVMKQSAVPAPRAPPVRPIASSRAPDIVVKTTPVTTPVAATTRVAPAVTRVVVPQPSVSAPMPSKTTLVPTTRAPSSQRPAPVARSPGPLIHPPLTPAQIPAHSVTPESLLSTAGAAGAVGLIGTRAIVHATQSVRGPAPVVRSPANSSRPALPSHYQGPNPAPNSGATPTPSPSYRDYATGDNFSNDATRDMNNSDNSYGGVELGGGVLGGAALGVGGSMAYEEYEEYAPGDEELGPETGDVTGQAENTDDAVYEDYNPEEDEMVNDAVSVTGSHTEQAPIEEGYESEGVVEDYDPVHDEVIDEGGGDAGEYDVEPAAEYDHSDSGLPEEPEHEQVEEDVVPAEYAYSESGVPEEPEHEQAQEDIAPAEYAHSGSGVPEVPEYEESYEGAVANDDYGDTYDEDDGY